MYLIELISALMGMIGALLLATRSRFAGWAFVLWLISNVGWIIFGAGNQHVFFIVQQVVFTVTSLIGIYRWLIAPQVKPPVPQSAQLTQALMHLRTLCSDIENVSAKWDDTRRRNSLLGGTVTLGQYRAARRFVQSMDVQQGEFA
ncbi:nicotinamide mononucleotide transporter [Diaphorobacter sp. HDW4A]|uniref:nicotinamide mononucleotide transporter n=1 Tax=Diaphorobacter sp. HDW4A TaxID=2714924 RepID=UPI00140AAC70|nr:nicotinamide mononucleotide transporter [Diaphorobacter sp. HDW4A]QIL81839.1 nicotinamide mononucleotide transporter [Diaphorobacter sp. HDW4A]